MNVGALRKALLHSSSSLGYKASRYRSMNKLIVPNERERRIFDLLVECIRRNRLDVELRVAGGWVRDKLLGIDCHDLDIAIDRMMGEAFASFFLKFLKERLFEASSCGVIASNPARSKHLETATMNLFGLELDFVNLRSEAYATDSRIPHKILFGSPLEDAQRRDITINALFYNLHSKQVEDHTGCGLDDLHQKIIRTPLEPLLTLMDDPLRVLRVIRFASRFGARIEASLEEALRSKSTHKALLEKVSRERVGIEVEKILSVDTALTGLAFIIDLGLYDAVFFTNESRKAPLRKDFLNFKFAYFEQMLAAALLPFWESRTSTKKLEPTITAILRDSLKLSNKTTSAVLKLTQSYETIVEYFLRRDEFSASQIGRLVFEIGERWRNAFELAHRRAMYYGDIPAETSLEDALNRVETLGLASAWAMKPLLNGTEIGALTSCKGPQIGVLLSKLMDWQFENPRATKSQAEQFFAVQV